MTVRVLTQRAVLMTGALALGTVGLAGTALATGQGSGVDGEGESIKGIAIQLREFFFALRQCRCPSPVSTVEYEQKRKSDEGGVQTCADTGALDQVGEISGGDKPGQ